MPNSTRSVQRPQASRNGKPRLPTANVETALQYLVGNRDVFEVRALGCRPQRGGRNFVSSGYFDDLKTAAEAVKELDELYEPEGMYFVINAVNPACLARATNEFVTWPKHTTTDSDIVRRRYFPVDFDPARPAGISATEAERKLAGAKCREVRLYLQDQGWPDPYVIDSGNGSWLLYATDEANDAATDALFRGATEALSERFSDGKVKVDTTVCNASHIARLPGTLNRKGSHTADRPHRRSRLLDVPHDDRLLTADQLVDLAGDRLSQAQSESTGRLDVAAWLSGHGIAFTKRTKNDKTFFDLNCVFHADHKASIIQDQTGRLGYSCFHDRCRGKIWQAVKAKLGPPEAKHYLNFQVSQVSGMGGPESGEPVEIARPDVPEFPVQTLPSALCDWVQAISGNAQLAPDLPAMMALAGTAAALAGKVCIRPDPGNPEYSEPANIWACAPLPSANRKSFVVEKARSPFKRFLREFLQQNPDIDVYRAELQALEQRKSNLTAQLAKAEQGDYERLKSELRGCLRDIDRLRPKTHIPRFFADDVTVERLTTLMAQNHGRIGIVSDEGGCFDHFAGVYNTRQNIDAYLQGHAGGQIIRDRQTDGQHIVIDRAALTIGVSPQPQVIEGLNQKQRLLGRGILARFLWSFPASTLGQRDWQPEPVPSGVIDAYERAIIQLLKLPQSQEPKVAIPADDAFKLWLDFAKGIEARLQDDLSSPGIQAWAGKLPGAVARIALLLHCVVSQPAKRISRQTMQNAITIGRYLIPHAQVAFQSLRADPQFDDALVLQGWICNRALQGEMRFTKSQLQQSHKNRFPHVADVDKPLTTLVSQQICRPANEKSLRPGRPSAWYEINPALGGTPKPDT